MSARSFSLRTLDGFRRSRAGMLAWESRRYLNPRLALIVWLILTAAVSVRTLVRPRTHTVFPIFAASVEHWWGDRSLYQLYPPLDTFRYPPVFAVFATPFAALGLTTGGILWSWLSIAVFLAGLWQYARDVIPSPWTRRRRALFLILGSLGALRGLWNAQSNALIAGFVLLGTAALSRVLSSGSQYSEQRAQSFGWWLAAVLLALPVCLKLTPLAPVLLLVALWPRQLGWRLLVVVAVFFLLPFLTRPPDVVLNHYREWIDHLLESGSHRWIGFRDGWTIWIVLRHLLGIEPGALSLSEPLDSCWYRLVQLTSATAALIWCLWQQRRAERRGLTSRWLVHVTLSMGLAWLMLFGPAVEHATYVFLAPPLIWAVLERRAWPHGRGLIWASFTLIMVLGWGAVTRALAPEWPVVLTALPAGTTLFALWLLGYAGSCGTRFEKLQAPFARLYRDASSARSRYLEEDGSNLAA
jgi:alpha-1,2-mannosyltransferase